MDIRLADETDFDAIKIMAMRFITASPYMEFDFNEKDFDSFIRSFLVINSDNLIFIAEDDEQPVGFVAVSCLPWNFGPKKVLVERALWVEPEYRKSGCSKLLIERIEELAWAIDCGQISLSALEGPLAASLDKFYTKLGYKRTEMSYFKRVE